MGSGQPELGGTAHGRAGAGTSLVSFPTRPFCDSCLQHMLQEQEEKEGLEPFSRWVTIHKRAKEGSKGAAELSGSVCLRKVWMRMRAGGG